MHARIYVCACVYLCMGARAFTRARVCMRIYVYCMCLRILACVCTCSCTHMCVLIMCVYNYAMSCFYICVCQCILNITMFMSLSTYIMYLRACIVHVCIVHATQYMHTCTCVPMQYYVYILCELAYICVCVRVLTSAYMHDNVHCAYVYDHEHVCSVPRIVRARAHVRAQQYIYRYNEL